ncbi:phage baseplate protein [Xanthobacter sp. VTT E-85241]|uniref:phage baseplate protein n=1 Tax=Roseixanthobacter finlandensis TaxID=3119922 RepID=UPI00372636D6
MALISQIRHVHWQLRAGETDPASGAIVTGYDDIDQEVRTIMLTPIGSVPCNPLKGCNILPYIDRPPEIALPRICQEVWDAVATWVTRIEVLTVTARAVEPWHFVVTVPWRVRGDVAQEIRQSEVAVRASDLTGGTRA